MKHFIIIIIAIGFLACNSQTEIKTAQGYWIKGTEQEKVNIIEHQFRGFDKSMVEVGYRYQELYWAGEDGNWDYANYQLDKIKRVIDDGLERRPKRAKSAEHFLTKILPEFKAALKSKDTQLFNKSFKAMTISCNRCHTKEKVPFFTVGVPTDRQSPIRN